MFMLSQILAQVEPTACGQQMRIGGLAEFFGPPNFVCLLKYLIGPSPTMDVVDPVVALKNALRARWVLLGHGFEEEYAMLLASNLHAHGVRVISDIDHID